MIKEKIQGKISQLKESKEKRKVRKIIESSNWVRIWSGEGEILERVGQENMRISSKEVTFWTDGGQVVGLANSERRSMEYPENFLDETKWIYSVDDENLGYKWSPHYVVSLREMERNIEDWYIWESDNIPIPHNVGREITLIVRPGKEKIDAKLGEIGRRKI